MAERIQVSSEDLQACAAAYAQAAQKLMQASQTYSQALQRLSSDWTGRAFAIMSTKVFAMLKNLGQSYHKCVDAISELIAVKGMFEENEASIQSNVNALDVGTSPFNS